MNRTFEYTSDKGVNTNIQLLGLNGAYTVIEHRDGEVVDLMPTTKLETAQGFFDDKVYWFVTRSIIWEQGK